MYCQLINGGGHTVAITLDSNYHHFAMTYSNTTGKLVMYWDGSSKFTKASGATILGVNGPPVLYVI